MKRTLALLLIVAPCLSCSSAPEPASPRVLKARLQQTLAGHTEVVWRVAFSPDAPQQIFSDTAGLRYPLGVPAAV